MRAGRASGSSVRRDSGILCIFAGGSHLDFGGKRCTGGLLYRACTNVTFHRIFAKLFLTLDLSVIFIQS
jgi:hypothetical protein